MCANLNTRLTLGNRLIDAITQAEVEGCNRLIDAITQPEVEGRRKVFQRPVFDAFFAFAVQNPSSSLFSFILCIRCLKALNFFVFRMQAPSVMLQSDSICFNRTVFLSSERNQ